jgi:hypothetical protein
MPLLSNLKDKVSFTQKRPTVKPPCIDQSSLKSGSRFRGETANLQLLFNYKKYGVKDSVFSAARLSILQNKLTIEKKTTAQAPELNTFSENQGPFFAKKTQPIRGSVKQSTQLIG